jgi:hypothetical protein
VATNQETAHLSQEALDDYHFNRLTEAERTAAQDHLRSCNQCMRTLDLIETLVLAFKPRSRPNDRQPQRAGFAVPVRKRAGRAPRRQSLAREGQKARDLGIRGSSGAGLSCRTGLRSTAPKPQDWAEGPARQGRV